MHMHSRRVAGNFNLKLTTLNNANLWDAAHENKSSVFTWPTPAKAYYFWTNYIRSLKKTLSLHDFYKNFCKAAKLTRRKPAEERDVSFLWSNWVLMEKQLCCSWPHYIKTPPFNFWGVYDLAPVPLVTKWYRIRAQREVGRTKAKRLKAQGDHLHRCSISTKVPFLHYHRHSHRTRSGNKMTSNSQQRTADSNVDGCAPLASQ